MIRIHTKHLVVLVAVIGLLLNSAAPGLTQTFPSWGNHEPSGGTGNTQPPSGEEFVRQDPMPENMQDITIFSSDKNGIKLKVEFPDVFDYELATGPDDIKYRRYKASSEFKIIGNPGEPEILNRVFWLQIPKDAMNIEIESTEQHFKDVKNEDIKLYPVPEIVFEEISTGISSGKEVFVINEEFYQKDQFFPQEPANIINEAFKHGMHLIKISVPVMIYNPKTDITQEIKSAKLTIKYEAQEENKISIDATKDPFHKIFNTLAPNYVYYEIPPSPQNQQGGVFEIRGKNLTNTGWANQREFYPDFLVIAAEKFDNPNSNLQEWAKHRFDNEQGGQHKIAIAYVDEIAKAYHTQELVEEKIQAFIEMVYANWRELEEVPNLHFLMLVGDADQGNNSATWFLPLWRSSEEHTASDNDYSWLEGDDEESDVLMGRLPAKDEEELLTMVKKITNVETTAPQGSNHYGTKSLLLWAEYIASSISVIPAAKYTATLLINKKQEVKEFHNYYLLGLAPFKFSSNIVTDFLNNEGALFINYTGHGGPLEFWPDTVNVWNTSNQDKMPIVITAQSCQTAHFDLIDENSYGEQWIKHENSGAISYFGATRNAIAGDSCGKNFVRAVFNHNLTILGQAIDFVRQYLPGDPFKDKKVYALLGDPALNFSLQMGQSTKPDLVGSSIYHNPEFPTYFNEPMNIFSVVSNTSDQTITNVPMKLFSVESGTFDNVLKEWNIPSFDPHESISNTFPLNYQGESSRFFLSWIDPDNTIEELSKFNNWFNYDATYFPIHVDASNTGGIQHGTLEKPFVNLADTIEYAIAHDYIGEDYRQQKHAPIKIQVAPGNYGEGDVIESKSLVLEGLGGAEKTIIFDSLDVTGDYLQVEGITFNGRKGATTPAITSRPGQSGQVGKVSQRNYFRRNTFKRWANDYAIKVERFEANDHQSRYSFYNNIFENNFGTVQMLNSPWRQNYLNFYNNTFANNENNLSLDFGYNPSRIYLNFRNNIAWETGSTTIEGELVEYAVRYNNIHDPVFWELGWATTQYENFQRDPSFKNPTMGDFTLNSDSESINKGDPDPDYNDPDGSRNDQGAFGGPQADMPPIRIINPIHGSTIIAETQEPISISIRWNAYKLNPENYVEIEMYHIEYEMASPDKGSTTPYYIGKKVIDIDNILVLDTGSFAFELNQENPDQTYYLTIRDPFINIGDSDKINFKVMAENQSIHNNR